MERTVGASPTPKWSVERVSVTGLFGTLDHEFDLGSEGHRAILIGPNGVGKTKLLSLVKALLNLEFSTLLDEPFRQLKIWFRDGQVLSCSRSTEEGTERDDQIELNLFTDDRFLTFPFSRTDFNRFEDVAEDRTMLERRREGRTKFWRIGSSNLTTDQLINFVMSERDISGLSTLFGEQLKEIKQFLGRESVAIIRADRLLEMESGINRRGVQLSLPRAGGMGDSIAGHLKSEFEEARLEYLTVSQELDSTFPARLLREKEEGGSQIYRSESELREAYDFFRTLAQETTGTIGIDQPSMAPIPDRPLAEWELEVLNLHASDGMQKIAALRSLSRRIRIFERLVNSKLVRSRIIVRSDGLYLKFQDGSLATPGVQNLSSGERHQIQMAFDLVFRSRGKRLVLIDEPELSLHVNWQTAILGEFEALRELNSFQYIVATHSPEIIGDAWGAVRALTLN